MAAGPTKSVRPDERIDTLDLLRGVAICGILLMNIPSMGFTGHRGRPPWPALPDLDWAAWLAQRILFEGSMRGLFTLLFGAGMLVMLRRTERDGDAQPMDVFLRRCLALLFFGLIQAAVFLWPGEILFNYGLTGFFLIIFRKARPKALLALSVTLLVLYSLSGIGQVMSVQAQRDAGHAAERLQAAGRPLTEEQQAALKELKKMEARRSPPAAEVAKEYKQRTRWPAVVGWSVPQWAEYNFGWTTWFTVLESFIFMLFGMALYRLDILGGARPTGFYVRLALVGYGFGVPLRALNALWQMKLGGSFDLAAMIYSNVEYEPARMLVTVGHVGLLCALWRAGALGRAWPVRALGRMALTTYSLESIITSVLFYGFGLLDRFGFAQLMGIAALIWVACGLFAMWWLRDHDMGPAEWALRRLAYGRRTGRDGALPIAGPGVTLAPA